MVQVFFKKYVDKREKQNVLIVFFFKLNLILNYYFDLRVLSKNQQHTISVKGTELSLITEAPTRTTLPGMHKTSLHTIQPDQV